MHIFRIKTENSILEVIYVFCPGWDNVYMCWVCGEESACQSYRVEMAHLPGTPRTVSGYKKRHGVEWKLQVSTAKRTCIFDGETQALEAVLWGHLRVSNHPALDFSAFKVAWVENLEKHSCKCKSRAIWAFSTLPAICGEKECLNYVNQRGRVGALLCLYSCSPAPALLSFMAQRYPWICWGRVSGARRRWELGRGDGCLPSACAPW